jgi:hypothetical protein
MRVTERKGAKKGAYNARYTKLIRPGNKVGLKETSAGKRLMFTLVDDRGLEVPASLPWEPKNERAVSVMAALGVSAERVFKRERVKGLEAAILLFDKLAKEANVEVNAYVAEDGGFASGLRPLEGKFLLQFAGVVPTYEGEGEKRVAKLKWKYIPGQPAGGNRKWASDPENRFSAGFVVVAGKHKGLFLSKMYHYAIVKDEDDEWVLDGESKRGAQFKQLLTWHKVPHSKLDPDKHFKDPSNGLPELDKMMKKHPVLLQGTVSKGWLNEIELPADGLVPDGLAAPMKAVNIGEDEDEKPSTSKVIGKLMGMIERRVRADTDKGAWLPDGRIGKTGRLWVEENLGAMLKKRGIDLRLAEIDDEEAEWLIGYLKRKLPVK